MNQFLSCDWGTSSFRLRLVQTATLQVLAEEASSQGIATTFNHWQQTGKTAAQERIDFYLEVIQEHLTTLAQKADSTLAGLSLVLSGMASSTIGLLNLPYQPLPFATDGGGLATHIFPASANFPHEILLISGVQSENDVMRGEETQLLGCLPTDKAAEGIYIFPGTHSKHLLVQNGQVAAFKTYMTGEFFDLLAHKSILSTSVQKEPAGKVPDLTSFRAGVIAATEDNLLCNAFRVRTNNLFEKLHKSENFNYLSGLLIGTELKDLIKSTTPKIYLCSGERLQLYYETALQVLGLLEKVHTFPAQWVDEAVIRGQLTIYNRLKSNA